MGFDLHGKKRRSRRTTQQRKEEDHKEIDINDDHI